MKTEGALVLRLFGGLRLERSGVPLTGPATRRKPLALLAVLAAHPSGISRDKLEALLWSEADSGSARTVLRQTLYSLRRALGEPDLFIGTTEVRLNPDVILSDVAQFDAALRRGDREAAIELYSGPFLDGFHLTRAAEFESWQEAERGRYDGRAREATIWLAEAADQCRATEAAVRWWKRVAELDPLSERAALGLMEALVRTGDAARALRHARTYARLVEEELGAPPSRAVLELQAQLRAAAPASAPLAVASTDRVAPPVDAPALPAPSPHAVRPRRPAPAVLALPVAVLLVSLLLRLGFNQSRGHSADGGSPQPSDNGRVAVLPFETRGMSDSTQAGNALSELLTVALELAGELRPINQAAVLTELKRGAESTEAAARNTVAATLGADLIVTGSVVEVAGRLRIAATMWRIGADGTDSVLATVSTEADSSELFRVADRLTANLLAESRLSHRVDRLQRLAAQTTDSLEALKLFLSGSGALRRGEYARAAALFAQAVEIDTTFALAYFRLAIASEWNIQYDRARTAVEQALAHSGRLPHSERLMAEALDAYLNGRAREAEAQLERAITARPEDTEAWFRLAELRFHFFAVRDHPIEDSYQAWQNVISADSNNMSALVHLVRIAALRADSATVDRLAARIRAASPAADRLWEVRALQAFVGGRPAAEDALLAEMRAAGDSALLLGFGISGFTDNVEGAHRLAVALNASADREMRKLALAKLAELELVSGRPAAADAWLIQLGALDSNVALMLRAYFATLPGLQRKTPVLVSIAADLERWRADLIPPSTAVGPMQAFSTLPSVMPQLHRYLQGRVAARLGRWAEVQLAESRLRVLGGPPHATALGEDLAVSLAAMHALGRGDSAGAAALLATLRMETPVELLNSSWFYSLYAEQFERAALAEWSGRPDLALETYAAVRHSRVLAAPAAFAIAGIHHRSGNRSAAIREYRRGLALWSSPEASALPLVNRARKRLREIEARPDLPRERTPTGGRQAGRSGEVDGAS